MNKLFALGIICAISISCAPPVYNSFITPEFEGKKIMSGTLVVMPLNATVVDYGFGSVENELGKGEMEKLVREHFSTMLVEKLAKQSTFTQILYDSYVKKPEFKKIKYTIVGLRNIKISLPAGTETIQFSSITPDYILFVQNLRLGTEKEGVPAGMMMMGGGTIFVPTVQNKFLRYKCEYAFWDNLQHKTITYGRIMAQSYANSYAGGMVQAVVEDNWEDVDSQFVKLLINKSPFRKE
jgi:hypothetical protein